MDLIFKRSQYKLMLGRTNFKLRGRFALTDEEEELIEKYDLYNAQLQNIEKPGLLRFSMVRGLGVFSLVFIAVLWASLNPGEWNGYTRISWEFAPLLGLIAGAISAYLYYNEHRSVIYVRDLTHGHQFTCKSVAELARTEAHLHRMAYEFRQLLEATKNWGGEEKHSIPVLSPEEAKQVLRTGPYLS